MARYRSYGEEMQHVRNLMNTVSSYKGSIGKHNDFSENEEQDDEKYYSDHDSSTEIESDL